jgi:hypothetical protein
MESSMWDHGITSSMLFIDEDIRINHGKEKIMKKPAAYIFIFLLIIVNFNFSACPNNQSLEQQTSEEDTAQAFVPPRILVLPFLSDSLCIKPDEEWPLFLFNMMHRELKRYNGIELIPRKQVLERYDKDETLTRSVLRRISRDIEAEYIVWGSYLELASGEFELNIYLSDKEKEETISLLQMRAESFFQLEQGWPIVEAAGKIAQLINGLSLVRLRSMSGAKSFTAQLNKTSEVEGEAVRYSNEDVLLKVVPDAKAYLTVLWILPDGTLAPSPPLLHQEVKKGQPVDITLTAEKLKSADSNRIHYLKIILSQNPLNIEGKASAFDICQKLLRLPASSWSEQTLKFLYFTDEKNEEK